MQKPYAIHWFRRDLRITGNPGLLAAHKEFSEKVLGVFFFDEKFLSRDDFSANRFAFFLATLKEVQKKLHALGSELLVLNEGPTVGFKKILQNFQHPPSKIFFCRDYEPFARTRDQQITQLLEKEYQIPVSSKRDHLIIEPEELLKEDGSAYKVYTPFCKKWLQQISSPQFLQRITSQEASLKKISEEKKVFNCKWNDVLKTPLVDQLTMFEQKNAPRVTVSIPKAGFLEAFSYLKDFEKKINLYHSQRDYPITAGTSRLSIYLKNGSITSSQVLSYFHLTSAQDAKGPTQFLKEIIWREFYYHILYHYPSVELESFNPAFKDLQWQNNPDFLTAWQKGLTGYPIVDAGMQQMLQTGWMHNRVRMIVASFLTKDLLVNWQEGERFFMNHLLDGDLAPNNGGWQWAASTGCDPQPYFRIFNPTLQSQKFDPDALYIKKWLPHLEKYPAEALHAWQGSVDHPAPLVNHHEQKQKALELYKIASQK